MSIGDCTAVGARTDTRLMLRGEFEVFLLRGAENVFGSVHINSEMLCTWGKIVQKNILYICMTGRFEMNTYC